MMINSLKPYEFPEGKDKAIENLMDLYTRILPLNERFYFDNYSNPIISKDYPEYKEHSRLLSSDAQRLMRNLGYLEQPKPSHQNCTLTSLGREVAMVGGHYIWLELKEEENNLFQDNISQIVLELKKLNIGQQIVGEELETFYQNSDKKGFKKFLEDKGFDLSIALVVPAILEFYNKLVE